nr:coiled-coil domain-containing protein 12 [Onthophagus taurus]
MENLQNNLEESALKRKERLKNLKRKKENDVENPENKNLEELPKPKFRSYNPNAEELVENKVAEPKLINIKDEIQDQLDAAKSKVVLEELDITTLAPRKPDWDLKRDVSKKLEKLERRTRKAIAEIIRERLKEKQADLASIVNTATDSPNNTYT